MANAVEDKYYLKTVHEEIGLYDRKLAHMLKYESFDNEADRAAATRKLTLKRDALAKTALRLAADGVEFKATEQPRSLRPDGAPEPVAEVAAAVEAVEEPEAKVATVSRGARRQASAFTGTSLDWQSSVQHYMQSKGKA